MGPSVYSFACPPGETRSHTSHPKVDKGFTDDSLVEGAQQKRSTKRATIGSDCGVAPADAARQLAWLRRSSEAVLPEMWRPPALHRAAARRWVMALDNQLRVGTAFGGLEHFRFSEERPEWASWKEWPGLGVSMDLASDGVAGACALQYGFDLNLWVWADPSHSCQRSFEAVLKDSGCWPFWLLYLISMNLEHGPHQDRHRHNQLRAALSELLEKRRPEDCPLFLQLAPMMARDLEDGGVLQFDRERSLEAELWEWLQGRAKRGPLGRRVSMNRFGGTQHSAKHHRPLWVVELFERTFLSLELDFLAGQRFVDKLTVKGKEDASLSGGTTDPRRLQVDDRALRGICSNAVAVSVLTLDDFSHRRVVDIILTAQRPLDAFHTEQNRVLRDVGGTRRWLLQQIGGGIRQHLVAFVDMMSDLTSLSDAGFIITVGAGGAAHSGAETNDQAMETLVEDESADLFGGMLLSFVAQRASRLLPFQGWPIRMLGAVASDGAAQEIIGQFQKDEELWKAFVSTPGKSAALKLIERRGTMNLRCVKQFSEAFADEGYQLSPDLRRILEERLSANIATQVIEDANGIQKNSSVAGQGRRYRKVSAAMTAVIEQNILSNRHNYTNLNLEAPVRSKESHLGAESFHPERKSMSFDYAGIASTSQQAKWWSPTAAGLSSPHADFELLAQARSAGAFSLATQAWLGDALTFDNRIGIGLRDGTGGWQWFLCLRAVPKSALMCWPAVWHTVPGTSHHFLEPDKTAGVVLKGIFSALEQDLKVVCYQWRSWLWQVRNLPSAFTQNVGVAIRPFVDQHGVQSLLKAGCRSAWWGMSRSAISELCTYFGIAVESGAGLADMCWTMAASALGGSDQELLDILHRRVARDSNNSIFSEALLEVDEALEVIDHMDTRKVQEAQREARSSASTRAAFKSDYAQRAQTVRAANDGAPRKKRKGAASSSSVATRLVVPPHHITQQEAKQFCPPQGSVWRSLTRGEWCAHLPEYRRITAPFSRYGGLARRSSHA